HCDYLETIDSIRSRLPQIEHFVALTGEGNDWLDYETLLSVRSPDFIPPEIRETDLLTINYTSGTTSRPKGVMITHRNSWMNSICSLIHHPISCVDRYLLLMHLFNFNVLP